MEARTLAAIDLRDKLGSAVPSLAKLLFLAGMHTPPVDSHEHMLLLRNSPSGARCRDTIEVMVSGENPMPCDQRQTAPATARNRGPILEVLGSILPASGLVLEVASGTGEHAVHFAQAMLGLTWQPSDPSCIARLSITAWSAAAETTNLLPPLDLDAASDHWPIDTAAAIICINMTHISPWASTEGLMVGAARILPHGAPLYLYGPFHRYATPLEPSNAAFDEALRSRDPRWGLRNLDAIGACAAAHGLSLDQAIEMPANNLSLILHRH